MIRRLVVAALISGLLLATLTACPPPPDVSVEGDPATPTKDRTPAKPPAPVPGDAPVQPGPAPNTSDDPAPLEDGPETPSLANGGSTVARRVVYQRVQGGTFVPRCPECGEVQPEGSTQCGGCGQSLTPFEKRVTCAACAGSGEDARSGDDRPCRACGADGACPYCEGSGSVGSTPCADCEGTGRCVACHEDGVRETFHQDFGPLETTLPGVCPTCIDGSGLCPECGSRATTLGGEPCLTCSESGICFDCVKTGASPHDGGEGHCLVCAGTGLEIRNGSPPGPAERHWTLRRAESGLVVHGFVDREPTSSIHIREQPREPAKAVLRSNLTPLSWYRVQRHWADSPADFQKLSEFARGARMWPLAIAALRRADQLGGDTAGIKSMRISVHDDWLTHWLERADVAFKAGDHETALVFTQMVRYEGTLSDSGIQHRAGALEVRVRRALEKAEAEATEEARTKRRDTARERLVRLVARYDLRTALCRRLLREAELEATPDAAREELYDRADRAAWSALRLVQQEAARWGPDSGLWPAGREPRQMLDQARRLRGQAVASHASRAVAAGRFAQGKHLAARARRIVPGDPRADSAFLEAERGLQRQGVLQGSPPR